MIVHAIRDNVAALRQGSALLSGLSATSYGQRSPACFNSSAGGHFRHVIEHYQSFLLGVGSGHIDYEARPRDPLMETDPAYALAQLEGLIDRLGELACDARVQVRAESTPAAAPHAGAGSSVLRELEFLLSHTVHHYALIGVICHLAGQPLPKAFGLAPSTLRHQRAHAAPSCAR